MSEWITLLQTFGLATVIILFIGLCLWKGGGWMAQNVVKPVIDRHISLMDTLIESMTKQGHVFDQFGTAAGHLINTLDNISKSVIQSIRVMEVVVKHVSHATDILRNEEEEERNERDNQNNLNNPNNLSNPNNKSSVGGRVGGVGESGGTFPDPPEVGKSWRTWGVPSRKERPPEND